MADQDGYVQVATDGSGKKIDNAELTRENSTASGAYVAGATVYRQRVALGSDENPRLQMAVEGEAGRGAARVTVPELDAVVERLDEILAVLRLAVG